MSTDDDEDTWIPAVDGDGDRMMTCRLHPEVGPFDGVIGCAGCHADDSPAAVEAERLSPEVATLLRRTAATEAMSRGMADMLTLESRAVDSLKITRAELRTCRKIAATCEARAYAIMDGTVEVPDREVEARKWLAEAVKYRMAAAKQVDTASKLIKLALAPAVERFEAEQWAVRERMLERVRPAGSHARKRRW